MKFNLKTFSYFILGLLIVLFSSSFKTPFSDNDFIISENSEDIEYPFFNKSSIKDGPYLFLEENHVTVKWIYKNRAVERHIYGKNFNVIKKQFGFDFKYKWINESEDTVTDYIQRFTDVKKIIALSDIHGQYEVLVKLLKEYNVIDDHFNWSYGSGHLVILGDVMDRGPRVTESFWLIYRLEKQAKEAGGRVHFLLGNHEIMVLNNDIRYINKKYVETAQLMETTYAQLYAENTIIGNWLRKKPVMVTINDMLFVHAGISEHFIQNGFTRTKTNEIFTQQIVGHEWKSILENPTLSFLMGDEGPIWYRGYFEDPNLTEEKVDYVLRYFDVDHVIVGHTSMPNIVSLFDSKVYGIDSSIKLGDYGEVLIYENGKYYRGSTSGTIMEL